MGRVRSHIGIVETRIVISGGRDGRDADTGRGRGRACRGLDGHGVVRRGDECQHGEDDSCDRAHCRGRGDFQIQIDQSTAENYRGSTVFDETVSFPRGQAL